LDDLSLMLCQDLSFHYGIYDYNRKKDVFYSDLVNHYQHLLNLTVEAKKCFKFYAQHINLQKTSTQIILDENIERSLELVTKNLEATDSFSFKYNAFNALYFKSYLEKDYPELEKISRAAIKYFRKKEGFSTIGEFSFLQKLGISYQAQGKYAEAIDTYHDVLKINPKEGTSPWYNIRNHLFNTHLAIKEYQNAYKYLLDVTTFSGFTKLFDTTKEPWRVKEAYMHLLIKMKKVIEDQDAENKLRPFRINRFLNEVPHFSKDKRGLNIAVLIIHVLFLFINKKEFEIEDRLNALGQYSFRYLRNDETLRSNAFIKMLQKLPLANFHPVRLKRHVEKFHKRLLETPMNISEQSAEIEIIPYEHLWEIVIELLEMRLEKKI